MQKKRITVLLSLALIIFGIYSIYSIYNLQGNARIINYTGVVRGATQRLVKQEVSNVPNNGLIWKLDGILEELQTGEGENNLILLKDAEYQKLLAQMGEMWEELKEEILKVRGGKDSTRLFLISESYFSLSDKAVNAAEEYTERSVKLAERGIAGLICLCLAAAGLVAWYSSLQAKKRLAVSMAEDENRKREEYLNRMAKELQAPMNEISELLYVADIENYDLLFINEAGKKMFRIGENMSRKCYEVLQGRTTPCPYCTNEHLKPGENYTWEFTNPILNRHYLLKDRMITWDGRSARIEIAFDTTESQIEKEKLKYTLNSQKMIVECIRILYQEHDLERGIDRVLSLLGSYLSADRTYIILLKDGLLHNEHEWCADGVESRRGDIDAPSPNSLQKWRQSFREQEYVLVEDVEEISGSLPEEYKLLKRRNIRSMVAVPLEREAQFKGCLGADNPPGDKLQNIVSILQTLSYFLMLAYRRADNEKQLAYLSYHDMLTMFYNRNRYMQDVRALEDTDKSVGVVYLDVNGLKDINDQHGHDFGDKILSDSAKRMKEAFQKGRYYRIGGDEFVIFSTGISREEFEMQVRNLQNSFKQRGAAKVAIGTGWTENCRSIRQVIEAADARMYEDKKAFYRSHAVSNRYRHHNDELLYLTEQAVLESEIEKGRFLVYMQPKIHTKARTIEGAEALIRYRTGDDALVAPGVFLPLLEEVQLVGRIDFFVFEYVCMKIGGWQKQGIPPIPVSVNFSRCSFAQPSFVKSLTEICRKQEVSPEFLEIEMTESVREVENLDIVGLIEELHQAGFRIALDDFGTEYANLALLSSANFDVLKLDKSIVDDLAGNIRSRIIVESMAETCRKLDIQVVAEGVETEEQLSILQSCEISLVQGYLFDRPLPMSQFEEKYRNPRENAGE